MAEARGGGDADGAQYHRTADGRRKVSYSPNGKHIDAHTLRAGPFRSNSYLKLTASASNLMKKIHRVTGAETMVNQTKQLL